MSQKVPRKENIDRIQNDIEVDKDKKGISYIRFCIFVF